MRITAFLFLTLPSCAFAGCFPVTGDRILGRDLALADPQFSAMPSSFIVSSAPMPGAGECSQRQR